MLKKYFYILSVVVFSIILFATVKNSNISHLLTTLENRSFDIRQNIIISIKYLTFK